MSHRACCVISHCHPLVVRTALVKSVVANRTTTSSAIVDHWWLANVCAPDACMVVVVWRPVRLVGHGVDGRTGKGHSEKPVPTGRSCDGEEDEKMLHFSLVGYTSFQKRRSFYTPKLITQSYHDDKLKLFWLWSITHSHSNSNTPCYRWRNLNFLFAFNFCYIVFPWLEHVV